MSDQHPINPVTLWQEDYAQALLRFAVCAMALMPLWQLSKNFQTDWDNHLWTIEYNGRYLKEHHAPPDVLNTPQVVGLASPIFYGSKFYTVLGILSMPLGSALAFRIFAFGILVAQSLHDERAVRTVCPIPMLRLALTSAVTLSVFRLITLCERGDLPEFTAINFLTMAVCSLFVLLVRSARHERDPYGWVATGFLYGIAAVTHPLTGFFGAVVLTVLGTAGWLATRRQALLGFGVASFAGLCLLLGAWLYAVIRFGDQVRISNRNFNFGSFEGSCLTPPLEALLSGFKAWAFHPFYSLVDESAGFFRIDLQLAVPLLVLCAAGTCLWRLSPKQCSGKHKLQCSLVGCSYTLFLISLLVFCSPGSSSVFGHVFDVMQFPYRLAAYIDLSLLVAALSVFGLVDWAQVQQTASTSCCSKLAVGASLVSLSLTVIGFGTKVAYIESDALYAPGEKGMFGLLKAHKWPRSSYQSWVPGYFGGDDPSLASLPALYFWICDYEVASGPWHVPSATPALPSVTVRLNVGPVWGSVSPTQISVERPTILVTNVSSFPWNALTLDGVRFPSGKVQVVPTSYPIPTVTPTHLAIVAGPGQHVLSYAFVPDQAWVFLQELSWTVLLAWTGLWLTVTVQRAVYRFEPRTLPTSLAPAPHTGQDRRQKSREPSIQQQSPPHF